MRRSPEENLDVITSTNVFSNDAWSNSSQTASNADENKELSKYAATALPDTFLSTTRPVRYAPSPHSENYEPSGNITNSENDPFEHCAYDGRPSAPLKQNARFEDMPSPLRKRKLGLAHNSFVSEPTNEPTDEPAQASVATPPAPTQPQTQTPDQNNHLPQTLPEQPIHTPQVPLPPAPPTTTPANTIEPAVEEIPLADFEREFIEDKKETTQEQIIDLTSGTTPITNSEPIVNPSLFTPSIIQTTTPAYEPIAYNTPDSIFGTQHLDISDSDRLYKDPKEPRDTIQIDLDFVKNLASKITLKMVAIGLIVLIVLIGAYIFLGPSDTSQQNSPAGNAEPIIENQVSTDKTVISPNDTAPNVEVPQSQDPGQQTYPDPGLDPNNAPSQSGGGAILTYDENGNAVYTSPTNQNFNGE